jgi:hypothetical protein
LNSFTIGGPREWPSSRELVSSSDMSVCALMNDYIANYISERNVGVNYYYYYYYNWQTLCFSIISAVSFSYLLENGNDNRLRRMPSSGMLRRVVLVVFLRSVLRLLVTVNVVPSSSILVILMMEAMRSAETSVLTRATR